MRIHATALAAISVLSLAGQSLPVTFERLLKAETEPGNWLMYNHTYNGWRYSLLDQITTQNVKNLHVKWLFQGHHQEKFETTPLVIDGIMYLTRPENDVFALDAETGRVMWTYSHKNPERTYNCCGRVNRGLAILGSRLFMNTLDMHLIALDARSGRELWKTGIYDYMAAGGYAATGAPLAVKDKVIVGMAGGEHPVSGFLDAYDAVTGKRVWRFHTIPQPGEANFGTWAGDSWKTGGVSTWNTGSYDPETNTLYWGTSNPWPDYNGDFRAGDNLYSCSVLALDADTGKLKWHYQFTPHDTHDWDATQIPILLDAPFRNQQRKLLAWAARNGFYYLLDRDSGEFLLARNFVRQTWARGFDDKGRPQLIPGNDPTPEGNDTVFPGVDGAANWMSHSYSPLTKLLYIFAREERRVFSKNDIRHAAEGNNAAPTGVEAALGTTDGVRAGPGAGGNPPPGNGMFGAGGNLPAAGGGGRGRARFAPEESWGKVVAIEPLSGEIKWEHKVLSPSWGGVMATAGNLVFGGTIEGIVFALDARTGERLWYFSGNDRVYASPISFLSNGKQYISLPVGDVLVTFGL
ncbi:MAG TPA: PQQ-dependent dehydrogenase, methanol/ethanol family [Candidatus Acidoferrales bacterium]|nr:PQQ-dependent dehydrogenase, methanol/ethanol family [Candidatus Acidoferrales bacterium]